MTEIVLDGESVTPADLVAIARDGATVALAEEAVDAIKESRRRVEDVLESEMPVYGINTGFGELVDERIPPEELEDLQTNLLRSHAAGTGRELRTEEVRAMLAARVNSLAKGYSGIRLSVVEQLIAMLNGGVHPVVKSIGSLGASGDLAPLAHASLVVIGEGEAIVDGERLDGEQALERIGLEPLSLQAKEGLALINGTQLTTGIAALALEDATRTIRAADVTGALTTEVTMSSTVPSHATIASVRPHSGQAASARNVRRCTEGSAIVESHRNCDRVQDAYSLRCLPQVHGAVRGALEHLREAVTIELNSATDNPLVFDRDRAPDRANGAGSGAVLSAGNFHGEELALRLDYARSALTELAAIAERRIDRMLNPNVQEAHLAPFLTERGGLHSGYMIVQYTAAALLNECRARGPHATDTTPVSGNQEDHVSMSAGAAVSFAEVAEMVQTVVAIELLCATQAADFVDVEAGAGETGSVSAGEESRGHGRGTGVAYRAVRDLVPRLEDDRTVHEEIETVRTLIDSGLLTDRVAERVDLE